MTEKTVVLPLNGSEVQEAILYKLAESMEKTCNLTDTTAYTSFRAEITVKLYLDDYGREVRDNHIVKVEGHGVNCEPSPSDAPMTEHAIEIPAQPPNQVRVETNQDVPVKTTEAGKQVIKKVKYAKSTKQPKQRDKQPVVSGATV